MILLISSIIVLDSARFVSIKFVKFLSPFQNFKIVQTFGLMVCYNINRTKLIQNYVSEDNKILFYPKVRR